jgi:F0F1-type ATP synthase assembly protein I
MQRLPPAARLIGIGWYFVVCIVGGLVGGVLLDRLVDSRPFLTLLGLMLGLLVAFYGAYHMLIEVLRSNQDPKD